MNRNIEMSRFLSFCLLLICYFCFLLHSVASQPVPAPYIHLDFQSTGTTWDGSCANAACPAGNPCRVPTAAIQNTVFQDCIFVFLPGDAAGQTFTFTNNWPSGFIEIQLPAIGLENAALDFTQLGPSVRIVSASSSQKGLMTGGSISIAYNAITTPLPKLEIDNVNLVENILSFHSSSIDFDTFVITNSHLKLSPPSSLSLISWSGISTRTISNVTIDSSLIEYPHPSSTNPAIQFTYTYVTVTNFRITNSDFDVVKLVGAKTINQLLISHSTIKGLSQDDMVGITSTPANPFTVSYSNIIANTLSYISNIYAVIWEIDNSILNRIRLTSQLPSSLSFSDSAITDSIIRANAFLSMDNVIFNHYSAGTSFLINGSPSWGPAHARNVTVFVDPAASGAFFGLQGEIVFDETSSLFANRITLSNPSNVTFANLTVTESISRSGASGISTMQAIQSISSPITWNWNPITIGGLSPAGVTVDLSNVDIFTFIATSSNQVSTASGSAISGLPSFMHVIWEEPSLPIPGTWYNIFTLTGYTGGARTLPALNVHGVDDDDDLFEFAIRPPSDIVFRIPSPRTCASPLPPGFFCIDGRIIAPNSIDADSITLPADGGDVLVNGTLTLSGILRFDGLGTTLNVSDCTSIGEEIEINLSKSKSLPSGEVLLVSQSTSGCLKSLATISISTKDDEKSCKKTKVKASSSSTSSTLIVLFRLDSSKCNIKWIILGSVLGAVLLIVIITLVLVFTFNEKAKNCVRPYNNSN
jgi:hypothetical protein